MNKPLKITLWSIVSLIFICLLVVGLVLYLVFTPSKLTRLVNRFAENYIDCPYEIGRIEPTFFSTFPQFGLKVDSIRLLDGDSTWASLESLQAKADLKALWNDRELQVDEVLIQGLNLHLSIDSAGHGNFEVFRFPSDTLAEKDSVVQLPFDKILLSRLGIRHLNASFSDARNGMSASLSDFRLRSKLRISEEDAEGIIQLGTPALSFRTATQTLAGNLPVTMHLPLHFFFENQQLELNDAKIELSSLPFLIDGRFSWDENMDIDTDLRIGEDNAISDYLAVLPDFIGEKLKGVDSKGTLSLQGHLKGRFSGKTLPSADIHLEAKNLSYHSDSLECQSPALKLRFQSGSDLSQNVHLSLSDCPGLQLRTNIFEGEGNSIRMEADLKKMLEMLQSDANSLARKAADQAGMFSSDFMKSLPEAKLQISLDHLNIHTSDSLHADLSSPNIQAEISEATQSACDKAMTLVMNTQDCHLRLDSTDVTSQSLMLEVNSQHRSGQSNPLREWNPQLLVGLEKGAVCLPVFSDTFDVPSIRFRYQDEVFDIQESSIIWGHSDIALKGKVYQLPQYLDKSDLLKAELDFVSHHADINELIAFTSGLGNDEDEEKTDAENNETSENQPISLPESDLRIDSSLYAATDSFQTDNTLVQSDKTASDSLISDAHPFIVPKGMDIVLHTRIEEAEFSNQRLHNLGGNLYVRDGVMILEEIGFICEAAKLNLTAMYKTPRPNHIYAGLDYHMTDVKIDEIVDMIPQVDSLLPMLRSFRGNAEFHIAAETYLTAAYKLKPSTLRGAASISGKDLILLDGEQFTEISKILMFNKKTENVIDSINAEMTLFRNEVDIYPLQVTMDKYKAIVAGHHNLDMSFDYHISLVRPLRIGVNVGGKLGKIKVLPCAAKYTDQYQPTSRHVVETQQLALRQMIREAIRKEL